MSSMPDMMIVNHRVGPSGGTELVVSVRQAKGQEQAPQIFPLPDYAPTLIARYATFDLVKPFMRLVLRIQPSSVTFDALCTDTADLVRMLVAMGTTVKVTSDTANLVVGDSPDDKRWADALVNLLDAGPSAQAVGVQNNYEHYAFSARSHPILILWVERVLRFFADCQAVLDLGCGTGVFLDQLTRRGISAMGVDANPASVAYARSLGVDATVADAADFLAAHPESFDAIHCSHLVEHLAFDDLQSCMARIAGALAPGGRAVFVTPDPESIRSQLLGFWRDPDHVRFYHADTLEMLGASCGLELSFNSQTTPPRTITGFSMEPPDSGNLTDLLALPSGEARNNAIIERLVLHERWIQQLWAVNQTWAWADDAVVVLHKPA